MERETVATQVAALCYRIKDSKTQILLVTSRTTRRWIIPKGWPMPRRSASEAARIEAWEEAGVRGKTDKSSIGTYDYIKVAEKPGEVDQPCTVSVFPMRVRTLEKKYPEMNDRERSWFSIRAAADAVDEPGLKQILAGFQPRRS